MPLNVSESPPETGGRHPRPSLRVRIFALLLGLVLTTTAWAGLTLWYTYQTQSLITDMADNDIAALLAAQGLESSLTMQKGFATYFFLSGDLAWLDQLAERRREFEDWIDKARETANSKEAQTILNQIQGKYISYVHLKDEVIGLYKAGRDQEGAAEHWQVRDAFEEIYVLCEEYKAIFEERISVSGQEYKRQANLVATMSWAAMPIAGLLGFLLGYILLRRVLEPIRRMALSDGGRPRRLVDEIRSVSTRMQHLVEDVGSTQEQLRKSRQTLMQSEKLALVGKLAAGVAHSIRNPLTSVKMRLFSLERGLNLSPQQKEDFEVISSEIRHLDMIIGNFLEFSRRPKLAISKVSPSEVVDLTLQLLRHKIESGGTEVEVKRDRPLPAINADPDQLKEALANILLNCCEAMGQSGRITIREQEGVVDPLGNAVIIHITDTGPGIPKALRDDIFQPFFSTKPEGTGLGLPIARRIMEEHGGWLHIGHHNGGGAHFVIVLPCREQSTWHRS